MVRKICLFIFTAGFFLCCKHDTPDAAETENGTPVKVTAVTSKFLNDTLSLFGTTEFLKKTTVTSHITGFVKTVNASQGDVPEIGKVLFTIQTREAAAYPANIADTLFTNSVITVKANNHFQIDSVLKQPGDFIQEGEVLCQTVDPSSMVVRLNFPFEKNTKVKAGGSCEIIFPDGKIFSGTVLRILTTVDAGSQTQDAYVKVNSSEIFPEKLNVQVKFSESAPSLSYVLPKEAILTDETMNEYWVMKLVNDTTAVKQDVSIGRKTKTEIEIIDPVFSADDRILVSGNYGLPDTAKVIVLK